MMFIIDCDTENGGMQLNNDFCVDFGEEPDGPSLAHEVTNIEKNVLNMFENSSLIPLPLAAADEVREKLLSRSRCATPEVTAPATSTWPTWTRLQRCRSFPCQCLTGENEPNLS